MIQQELLITKYEILEWIIQLNDLSILEQIKKLKVEENTQPSPNNRANQAFPISFQFGSAKGLIKMSPDFDDPLDEFGKYV